MCTSTSPCLQAISQARHGLSVQSSSRSPLVPDVVSIARAAMLLVLVLVLVAEPAHAQWYGAAYLGGNYTQRSDIRIEQAAEKTSLTFRDLPFRAEPLKSPQYYGGRFGRMFGSSRSFGLELEFIHLKVIGRTGRTVAVSGQHAGVPVEDAVPMETYVQRYSMTHGLNFLLLNIATRAPLGTGERLALVGRIGGGPTLPHAESTVGYVSREQYQYAGMGAHAAAGVDIRLWRRVSAMLEYKFTAARPTIDIHEGLGRSNAFSHHIAAGLAFGVSR